jgi:hypothetical protein
VFSVHDLAQENDKHRIGAAASTATVTGADNEQQNELAEEIPHRISLLLFILSEVSPSSLSKNERLRLKKVAQTQY